MARHFKRPSCEYPVSGIIGGRSTRLRRRPPYHGVRPLRNAHAPSLIRAVLAAALGSAALAAASPPCRLLMPSSAITADNSISRRCRDRRISAIQVLAVECRRGPMPSGHSHREDKAHQYSRPPHAMRRQLRRIYSRHGHKRRLPEPLPRLRRHVMAAAILLSAAATATLAESIFQ